MKTDSIDTANLDAARDSVAESARAKFAGKSFKTADGDSMIVPWQGIKHAAHGASPQELAALENLDAVIQGGRKLREEADKKGRPHVKAVHVCQAGITVDGENLEALIFVREGADGRRFYDQAVVKERPAGISGDSAGTNAVGTSTQPATGRDNDDTPDVQFSLASTATPAQQAALGKAGLVFDERTAAERRGVIRRRWDCVA